MIGEASTRHVIEKSYLLRRGVRRRKVQVTLLQPRRFDRNASARETVFISCRRKRASRLFCLFCMTPCAWPGWITGHRAAVRLPFDPRVPLTKGHGAGDSLSPNEAVRQERAARRKRYPPPELSIGGRDIRRQG